MNWVQTLLLFFIIGCSKAQNDNAKEMEKVDQSYTYLALGDSYTIGESVNLDMRWPEQLAKRMTEGGIPVDSPRIIATTGWTTDELQKGIIEAEITKKYDIVSLLIGVNNQYRGYPFEDYEREFTELLIMAIQFASTQNSKVFVVSIPDYGVTPFGRKKNSNKIALEIDQYNAKAKEICEERGILFVNITDISKKALNDTTLVATDGLHPSGKMYKEWVRLIYPQVKKFFE